MRYLALITARGGSKRIPNKNVKLLGGYPLIWYTLYHLQGTRYAPEAVAVSTDDERIMTTAFAYRHIGNVHYQGVRPIWRPPELAQDDTEHLPVVRHAVDQFPPDSFDAVVTLHPTSPFRLGYDIDNAVRLASQQKAQDSWHEQVKEKMRLGEFGPEDEYPTPPDFPTLNTVSVNPQGVRNAAIYVTPITDLYQEGRTKIYNDDSLASPMGAVSSLDINTPEDWDVAEATLREHPEYQI